MRFTRRQFLGLAGISLLAVLGAWWSQRSEKALAPNANLSAWVDTLVPAEPDFPGALALGVAARIADAIARQPQYAKLAVEAWSWIDAQARAAGKTNFATLSETDREKIVAAAAASALGTAQRTFFQATLDDALFHTYADPQAWDGLNYAGPPQPIGFLDHTTAPKAV